MVDADTRIARASETLADASKKMAVSLEKLHQTMSKIQHPAYRNRTDEVVVVVEEQLSTTISLELPDIEGSTTIYRQNDGFLRIEILVEPKDSERLVGLMDSMSIRQFVVSAVDPV